VTIPNFNKIIKDSAWRNILEKEHDRKDAHPDFQYTKEKWEELKIIKEVTWAKMEALINGSRFYRKPSPKRMPPKSFPSQIPYVKPKQGRRKVGMAILAVSIATILIIAFVFSSGIVELDIGTPSTPSSKETTISRVITQGKISVFEDEGLTKPVQTIDWGKVESNHQYSHTIYVRNDNQEEWLDWGKRDIVWQRENVNPSFVYISIKVSYGDTKIKPNEVRQATITLTVLGLLEDSDKLNPNADIPQFTFDLILKGQDLSLFTYAYIRTYANRDANNITVVYKDELKETISVIIEIGVWKTNGDRIMDVVWNSTRYASEFTETWLEADIYTSYQLIVTINHERYGTWEWRQYLVGQLP